MNLRDQIAIDVNSTFMNTEEFAESHYWSYDIHSKESSKEITMMVENFTLDGRPLSYAEGVSVYNAVIHVATSELGYIPEEGQFVRLDGRIFYVNGVGNEFGMLKIILKAHVS